MVSMDMDMDMVMCVIVRKTAMMWQQQLCNQLCGNSTHIDGTMVRVVCAPSQLQLLLIVSRPYIGEGDGIDTKNQ